jgi:pimeloyl-ACP methyl ester carboxylesterase
VAPDLRGIGRSSKPADGYEKKTQAKDMRAVVTSLGYDKIFVVAYDIGNMVAYAYAATYPDKVERFTGLCEVTELPVPGLPASGNLFQYYWDVGGNSRVPDAAVMGFGVIVDFWNLRA